MELKFKRDTSFRKQFFVPDSFAHPAKMDAQLLIWIVERYTQPGEVILDPMAGMGTTMLACTLGRNCILVELEEKFIRMCLNNRQEVRMHPQLGHSMGECPILWGDARDILRAREHPYEDLWLKYPKLDYSTIKSIRRHNKLPLRGDARQLEGLLVDKIVTSPPYGIKETSTCDTSAPASSGSRDHRQGREGTKWEFTNQVTRKVGEHPSNIANLPYGQIDKIVTSPPFSEAKFDYGHGLTKELSPNLKGRKAWEQRFNGNPTNPDNIANLPYGQIDKCIFSPPYASPWGVSDENRPKATLDREIRHRQRHPDKFRPPLVSYSENMDNIGNLPYGQISSIITSPPYENQMHPTHEDAEKVKAIRPADNVEYSQAVAGALYKPSSDNIGNLKSESYLEAMLQVYQQCHAVLRPEGLMVLVCKNFIRNKQVIRLDLDTIKLCEQAGFSFVERHYRKLPAQSFWRIIYHQKHPDVEQIKNEDILVFQR